MFVYVIAEPGAALVKIGRANHVGRRLSSLRTGSPVDLEVRAQWLGTGDDEKALHRAFAERRVRGEWFDFGADDVVQAVTDVLGRQPVQDIPTDVEMVEREERERRQRRKVDALPTFEDLSRHLNVYRMPDGQVMVERLCMDTCVGSTYVWGPGHKHEFMMSAEQYEEFGPQGPPLGRRDESA